MPDAAAEDLPVSPHIDRAAYMLQELEKALRGVKLAQDIAAEALVAARDFVMQIDEGNNEVQELKAKDPHLPSDKVGDEENRRS